MKFHNLAFLLILALATAAFGLDYGSADLTEDWPQLKFDSRHSGNVPDRSVTGPLGLVAAAGLTDAVFTAPVVADGRVYVVDGSGVAFCFDAETLELVWKFATDGGKANCNNVCSPAIVDGYLHFGTMAGTYYVLNASDGSVVRAIDTSDPIFSAPVLSDGTVYFATLGSRVYALKPDGTIRWTWDFVKERLGISGDRWDGAQWIKRQHDEAWRKNYFWNRHEQFCCNRNLAVSNKRLVLPAGGAIVWLQDTGDSAKFLAEHHGPREAAGTLGLCLDENGTVLRQWHRRDNGGSLQKIELKDGKIVVQTVPGTETNYFGTVFRDADGKYLPNREGPGLLSFCSASVRGTDVYRCRPQEDFALCKHSLTEKTTTRLGGFPSIAAPILLREHAVFGGLDGQLHIIPLSGQGDGWSFRTAFDKAITAPVAVCDGRIYFACEDGHLYCLGPDGDAPLPTDDLRLHEIRSRLTSKLAGPKYDWFTNYGNRANTNTNDQGLRPPLKLKWIRRYKGTVKHFSVCGGGRMYTHTAEGQIFAVEQETGRLLWRRYFPGVYVSFTAPVYHGGCLLIPQAGLKQCRLRCLDAATGELLWEAPFTGSPSWNRQLPPIVYKNLVVYPFSSGSYTPKSWLFEHQSTFGSPPDHKPLVRAFDLGTGEEVWTEDFSQYGAGGDDAGMCLMDGTLYYSCYFGNRGTNGSQGVTAALEPKSGNVLWTNTDYAVHAGCTVSGDNGRLYLGGYNPVEEEGKVNRVWCLNAEDGSLAWKSEPLTRAIHVITIGKRLLFTHSQYQNGYLLDKQTGKILQTLTRGYRCTRFTMSEPYLLGPNMDLFDLSDPKDVRYVWGGPPVDVMFCVGAFVSNGRVFYTTNGAGLQVSAAYGEEADRSTVPWQAE